MKMFIDIGNTNIKVHYLYNDQSRYLMYKTKDTSLSSDTFYTNLPDELKKGTIERIMICSVVVSVEHIIVESMKKYFKDSQILMLQYPIKTGIELKVQNPKEVGADLVALAAYGASRSNNTIIVNAGTATTISHIKDKRFIGVIILPGIFTSLKGLVGDASLINEINPKPINKKVGTDTFEAISIGLIDGSSHMIKGFIESIDKEAKVIISGGASYILTERLKEYEFVKEATIEGMKVIENGNK